MDIKDKFGIALVVLGIVGYALNYVTHRVTWHDDEFGTDNSRLYLIGVVSVLFSMMLLAAACWVVCVIEA